MGQRGDFALVERVHFRGTNLRGNTWPEFPQTVEIGLPITNRRILRRKLLVLSCDKKKELVIVVDGAHGTRLHRQAATRKQIG